MSAGTVKSSWRDARAGVAKHVGSGVVVVVFERGKKCAAVRLLVGVSAGAVKSSRRDLGAGVAKRVGVGVVVVVFERGGKCVAERQLVGVSAGTVDSGVGLVQEAGRALGRGQGRRCGGPCGCIQARLQVRGGAAALWRVGSGGI